MLDEAATAADKPVSSTLPVINILGSSPIKLEKRGQGFQGSRFAPIRLVLRQGFVF